MTAAANGVVIDAETETTEERLTKLEKLVATGTAKISRLEQQVKELVAFNEEIKRAAKIAQLQQLQQAQQQLAEELSADPTIKDLLAQQNKP